MSHPILIRAQRTGTPLVDGETVTFVWHGEQAPRLIGDVTGWDPGHAVPLTPVAPGLWTQALTLPRDAYVEYAFWDGQRRVPDPLNPRATPDGLGHTNHFFYMPDAAPTPLTRRKRGTPRGTVTRHVVRDDCFVVGGHRTVHLYRPPTTEPTPLLVVLDGQDYLRRARLPHVVDNLIAQGRIRPLALAMVHHGRQARFVEYACDEATLGLVLERVLPLARAKLNLLDAQAHPGTHGVLGASMGGLMALYMGLRAPDVFGRVLSQSGAFGLDGRDLVVFDLVRDGPVRPLRIWMDVGRFDRLLDANRRMHELLAARGYDMAYREYNGGHNYPSWRDDLWRGLETLFGGRE